MGITAKQIGRLGRWIARDNAKKDVDHKLANLAKSKEGKKARKEKED